MRSDALGFFWEDRPVVKVKKEVIKRTPPARTWEDDSYLPHYQEALAFNVPLYSEVDLLNAHYSKEILVWDTECYRNYFCLAFRGVTSKKIIYFELKEGVFSQEQCAKITWILQNFCTVGFNSDDYDFTTLSMALAGYSLEQLKFASDMIIQQNMTGTDVLREFKCKKLKGCDHIDLIEVAPLRSSLKIYGGRIHTRRMQDLPFAPARILTPEQQLVTLWYCINDLDQTLELLAGLETELTLRVDMSKEYNLDLRSKSDAQMAEAIIGQGVRKINGRYPQTATFAEGTTYFYKPPAFLKFQTPLLNWVLNRFTHTPLVVGEYGKILCPPEFEDFVVEIAGKKYKLGIGGIHSQEESVSYFTTATHTIKEIDVVSFYPFIIILLGLFPAHLGRAFLTIFETIVYRRLDAKEKKLKKIADSLKIVINGTFGKMGNQYSIFYEPDLLINVTFTGQLSQLMLIEDLELNGIEVISANTDGILTNCPNDKADLMQQLVKRWEANTGFKMEESIYWSVHKRDVNNYINVKPGGDKFTVKGIFKDAGLQKNPANEICFIAVRKFVSMGVPIEETIRSATDIRNFVTVRAVTGGAVKVWKATEDSPVVTEYIGKAIRWYYATGVEGEIVYAKSGNKVPRSDGAKPLLDLPAQLPNDIDYDWYIAEAYDLLKQVSYPGF